MRQTKIIVTLGPATEGDRTLRRIIEAGADIFRVNFSHGDHETNSAHIARVRRLAEDAGRTIAVLQDLQGPKLRIGALAGGEPVELRAGDTIAISSQPLEGTAARISTTYKRLPHDVRPGDAILLSDGRIALDVRDVSRDEVRCVVRRGGTLRERAGMNVPAAAIKTSALTRKDRSDLRFGLAQDVDLVALSFVRRPEDARPARVVMDRAGVKVPLIAKIEKPEALERLDEIIRAFDGVMVARGDLGVELSPEKVPAAQKRIIERANRAGKPVITATQMLESMIEQPQPTRAEASDIANAVLDGTDAVMLSGETAIGRYAAESVEAMVRIVREAEMIAAPHSGLRERSGSPAYAVCHAAVTLAVDVGAAAIAAFTRSGRTARTLSKLRPAVPIFALCEPGRERLGRELMLWRDVVPVLVDEPDRNGDPATRIAAELRGRALLPEGRQIVVVGAAPGGPAGRTNFVRLVRA